MTRCLMLALALLTAPMAAAQPVLPALHDVTGVAVGDVLNIRAKPSANSAIVGTLPRNAKSVEVVAVDATGKWASVNTGEGSGYASMRFLSQQDGPDWGALERPLHCIGTEPFWALGFDPATGMAGLSGPESPDRAAVISAVWPNNLYQSTAAIAFGGAGFDGIATLHGESCSDGMSDSAYGIAVSLFMRDASGAASAAFTGCCSLTP